MHIKTTTIKVLLPESTHQALLRVAESHSTSVEQFCSILLTEVLAGDAQFAQREALAVPGLPPVPPPPGGRGPREHDEPKPVAPQNVVTEMELIKGIIDYLKQRGGSAPKAEVENAVFQGLSKTFQDPYYSDCVGGSVQRWKKNVQFARNTAKNIGLIKPPQQSGRGIWELTDKGHKWQFS